MIYDVPVIDPGYVLALVVASFLIAFMMAFAIGANDVANSFGTSVGSGVLTLRQAYAVAVVFEILGAVLIGYKVSDTVRKDIVDVAIYRGAEATFLMGELSALGGGCLWILIATFLRIPVSATHSVVGATLGFSIVARGFSGIQWPKLAFLAMSWLTSPFLSGLVSCVLFALLRNFVLSKADPVKPGLRLLPLIYAFTLFINAIATLMNGSTMLGFDEIKWYNSLMLSIGLGIICGVLVYFWLVPWQRAKLANAAHQRRLEEQVEEQRLSAALGGVPHARKSDFLRYGDPHDDMFDSVESLDYEKLLTRLRDASQRAEYHRNDVDMILSGNQIANISPHGSVIFDETRRGSNVQDVHRSIIDKYGLGTGAGRSGEETHLNTNPVLRDTNVRHAPTESRNALASQRRHSLMANKYRMASIEEDEMTHCQSSNSLTAVAVAADKVASITDQEQHPPHPHSITIIENAGSKEKILLTPLPLLVAKSATPHIPAVTMRRESKDSVEGEERYDSSGATLPNSSDDGDKGDDERNDDEESEDDVPHFTNNKRRQPAKRVYVVVRPEDDDDDSEGLQTSGDDSYDHNDDEQSPKNSNWFVSTVRRLTRGKSGCDDDYSVAEADVREHESRPETKQLFAFVQVLTGAFASFAHGGNDVSNAIGPLTAIWLVYQEGRISSSASPVWLLFYGGLGIATGLCLMGSNVIETIGRDLTPLSPASGFCAELGTALTVIVASKIGIPISTTHCIVGSVVSIGWFRSRRHVDLRLFRNIFFAWLITLPASMLCASVIMLLLNFASARA